MVEQRERRGGQQIARLIGQSMCQDFESVRRVVNPVEDRFRTGLARALPDLPRTSSSCGSSGPEQLAARITAVCTAALTATP